MKTIITIQHTESEQHINGMIGSVFDWDLTENGIAQAQRVGKALSNEFREKKFAIYSSDLLRARHTADIIAHSFDSVPIYTDVLREFDLGEAVGKSKAWARGNRKSFVWQGTVDWASDIDGRAFDGAESKRDVWNRLMPFVNGIMKGDDENIIIVSHDGTLSIFYAVWLGLDIEFLGGCNFNGKSGGVSILCEDDEGHRIIKRMNDMSYQM
ncbi:MAG: histidine phosphatase family protein [Ruminococcaceae bacterium]|nr:histidine phosphatase family protein [Oscillospiraceae bacterium]